MDSQAAPLHPSNVHHRAPAPWVAPALALGLAILAALVAIHLTITVLA